MRLKIRRYSELILLPTLEERFRYLRLDEVDSSDPYAVNARFIKQSFYRTREWRSVRNQVVVRDGGCDLGVPGHEISGEIFVHHINPINVEMFGVDSLNGFLLDPEFLICVSKETHEAIHHALEELPLTEPIVRRPNDTCPWKDQNRIKF